MYSIYLQSAVARKPSFECFSAAATPIEHFVGNFLANFQRSLS
ncbi:hypothetical protein [Coleofasciculus sp. FACHB-125]